MARHVVTIVTPAYNEAGNLQEMAGRLRRVLQELNVEAEWLIVDDHSRDETPQVVGRLAEQDGWVRAFRLSRNCGSHTAIACGLHHARGDCAIVMAADLQDPPEEIPRLLEAWRNGAQVVWAARRRREGVGLSQRVLARLYYALMRRTSGLSDLPLDGADFFLVDRRVIDAFNQFRETHVSILALITWMGFRQTLVHYTKQARRRGRSGWSLEKKLKLVADSVTAFTYFPIRLMSYVGFVTALAGFGYAAFVVWHALHGVPPQGWTSLMVVCLVLGGIQMVMLGVLGEYLWRALDETRARPRYLIESIIGRNAH